MGMEGQAPGPHAILWTLRDATPTVRQHLLEAGVEGDTDVQHWWVSTCDVQAYRAGAGPGCSRSRGGWLPA